MLSQGAARRAAAPLAAGLAALVAAALVLAASSAPPATHAGAPVLIRQTLYETEGSRLTSLTFGPDGRLYVSSLADIHALTLDPETGLVTEVEEIAAGLEMVIGIAFDPVQPSPVALYASRQQGSSTFRSRVSTFTAPDWARQDIITGLSASDIQHQTNGLAFKDGQLLIAQGGLNQNGLQEELPLTTAILRADVHAPSFDGAIVYDTESKLNDANLINGDVEVFAPGQRNPYDLVAHTNGYIYASDNGGVGPDELNLIEEGRYYGFPNGNRCRFDARECVFYSGSAPGNASHTAPLATWVGGSACNGLAEYTSDAHDGAMLGDLLCVGLTGDLWWIKLSEDGRSVLDVVSLDSDLHSPLDVAVGPDGTIYVADGDVMAYYPSGAGPIPTETPTPTASPTPSPPSATPGDANCDGALNAIDAALILQYAASLVGGLPCLDAADINHDGSTNSIDAAIILQCVALLFQCS